MIGLKPTIILLLSFTLFACAMHTTPTIPPKPISLYTLSELQQGKRLFGQGYYKRAMRQLLPIACDGNAEAQYAVGYMYYYGYGVAQDTPVGFFWIKRSADQSFLPALKALSLIEKQGIGPSNPPCFTECQQQKLAQEGACVSAKGEVVVVARSPKGDEAIQ